ncbi:hypothetical protein A2715_02875 [Candidatus Woesebacteria bacterium RIFCSPHIGHO2_01_FULL_39_32]|uniref:Uncharacterized protein n=1 Tax=Candidatus Woesebacteria bacterium RIFCSPLOWO2_01_FULL_39_25 TaxID=1802521 RepID=A0A1F8BMD7_9BACT|nr:MAG: hypothetical protein A2715_02875 [Candidatus Woesebacteria bacterium RIFCSPHIGHO2_01_FULL_39_32]OGM37926.1 MAG: hypothetical protein A3F01_02885 [Candidatus Woesebacteria bacterium RIFCSPHIGHO2_12_FULL_38_11]OGM64438.1 MAG: hypothetical protein A2893_01050 [Candidatus Woesebacteria bacterium RIFCSPLOWO2_01_FULL_39_25]
MNKTALNSLKILNVRIDSSSTASLLRFVRSRLTSRRKFFIVTPNPEQVMRAQTDEVFKKILNSADISIPDGVGLVAAHKFLMLPSTDSYVLRPFLYFAQGLGVGFSIFFDRKWVESSLQVIRGRDLFYELIKLANKKGWRVFLVGDELRSAQKAADILSKNYKNVNLFAATGPNLDQDANPRTKKDRIVENATIDKINKLNPELLFIGFGAPLQEKWLYRYRQKLNYGGAMVIGGTFDYVSGKKSIPPNWVSESGLEWLWRLIFSNQKPKRVFSAFPSFPLKVYLHKLNR